MTLKNLITLIIGVLSATFLGLGGFWFGSIASDKDVQGLKLEQASFKKEVEDYYSKKSEVQKIDSKVDNVLTGLCIIDRRTCILKTKKAN